MTHISPLAHHSNLLLKSAHFCWYDSQAHLRISFPNFSVFLFSQNSLPWHFFWYTVSLPSFFIPLKTFHQWDVINSLLRLNSAFIQMSTPPGSTGISRVDPTSHSSLTGLKAISALVSLRIVLALGIKQKVGFAFQESFFFPWLFLCKLLEIVLSRIIYCTWVWVLELVCPSQDWEEACVWWGRAETKQLMTLYHLDSQLSESTKISHFLFLFFLQSTYSDLGSCGDPAYKM